VILQVVTLKQLFLKVDLKTSSGSGDIIIINLFDHKENGLFSK